MDPLTSETERCIKLLAAQYQQGRHEVTCEELFPNTKLSQQQILSVAAILASKNVVTLMTTMDKILPHAIQIMPEVIDAASRIKSKYSYDSLMNRFKSYPWVAIPTLILLVVTSIVVSVKLIWPKLFSE